MLASKAHPFGVLHRHLQRYEQICPNQPDPPQ